MKTKMQHSITECCIFYYSHTLIYNTSTNTLFDILI